jgi:hypothetical protein
MPRIFFWACSMAACCLAAGGWINTALAQNPAQAPTTVQLPTFSFFTVQTAVSVPDRGGTFLGGINTARDGSTSRGFGPLRNRGSGSERGASLVSVHATIIDLRAIDEAILAEAAAMRDEKPGARETDIKAELLRRHVGKSSEAADTSTAAAPPASAIEPLAGSVAAIRAQNAAAREERAREAADLFARGQKAEGEGKPGVAKVYYKMVVARKAGDVSELALARIAMLDGKQAPVAAK